MEVFDQLNGKVNLLIKKYAALEAENVRLRNTIAKKEKTETELKNQLASLEAGMVSVNINGAVENDEERQNMRKQLDKVISEIDAILEKLND